jgi:hypothetical protein
VRTRCWKGTASAVPNRPALLRALAPEVRSFSMRRARWVAHSKPGAGERPCLPSPGTTLRRVAALACPRPDPGVGREVVHHGCEIKTALGRIAASMAGAKYGIAGTASRGSAPSAGLRQPREQRRYRVLFPARRSLNLSGVGRAVSATHRTRFSPTRQEKPSPVHGAEPRLSQLPQ